MKPCSLFLTYFIPKQPETLTFGQSNRGALAQPKYPLFRLFGYIILALSWSFVNAQDSTTTRLKPDDIPKVMQQIFAEHVDHKQMTADVMKDAIHEYIDHFDPKRVYLLSSEVNPYLQLSDREADAYVQSYNQKDFTTFSRLDDLFQQAIYRARSLRHLSEQEQAALFQRAENTPLPAIDDTESDDNTPPFADSSASLRERWKDKILRYVQSQIGRSGEQQVKDRQRDVIAQLESNARESENRYLYVDAKGTPLQAAEKQHYATLHILKALASSLDPHTAFFDNTEAFEMKTNLDKGFEGIGIIFAEGPDGFLVQEVIPDSPAEKSKLVRAKDHILAINGEKLRGKSLEEVVSLVRGKSEHPITLLLRHPSEGQGQTAKMIEVRLTPQLITLNSDRVESGFEPYEDGIIGWVTLHSFYEGVNGVSSAEDLTKAINELKTKGNLKGLVLDLRDNGGGYLTQAVKVTGLFISNGVVVISKYNDGSEHFYRDIHSDSSYQGPLVVLTSRLTASAAEIVAQSLQDYGVAVIVGDDRTYGKGTIQAQTVTDDHSTSYFKVTVGKYYTVSGKTAQITGVKSDIQVPGPYSQMHVGEAYLKEALPNDTIESAYADKLQDLDPYVRNWYFKYYIPTLQKPEIVWKQHIPELKQKSAERLKINKDYHDFLNRVNSHGLAQGPDSIVDAKDLQMAEALNIVKDMNRYLSPNDGRSASPPKVITQVP